MDVRATFNQIQGRFTRLQLSGGKRVKLYRKLSNYLTHSVSMDRAFEILGRLYRQEKRSDVRATALRAWSKRLADGDTADSAMAPWISTAERMVLLGARESGDYVTAFQSAANLTDSSVRMKGAVGKALIKPTFLLLMLMAVMVLLANVLLPQMTSMLPPSEWHTGQTLYWLGNFIDQNLTWLLSLPVIAAVVIVATLGQAWVPGRFLLDKAPPWLFYRIFQSASVLIALSAMTQAGQSVHESLRQIHKHSNPYVAGHVRRMLNRLERGDNPGTAVGSTLLTGEMKIDVRAYGEIGDFTSVLDSIGTAAVNQAIEQIQQAANWLGNAMLALVGGLIIWIYATFFSVLQQIQQAMGGVG